MERKTKMDFEDLLLKIGGFQRYQLMVFSFGILTVTCQTFLIMGMVFFAAVPDHHCALPELDRFNLSDEAVLNLSIPLETKDGVQRYSQCEMYDRNYSSWTQADIDSALNDPSLVNESTASCSSGWVYDDSIYQSSIVTEWDLVCEDKWKQATSSAVYMAGLMFGVLISGIAADYLGRLTVISITLPVVTVSAIAVGFSPSFEVFLALRFILAFTSIGVYTTMYIMYLEILCSSRRVGGSMIYMYSWCFGYILFTGLAFGIRNWRWLNLAASTPLVLTLGIFFILLESPRWLYTQKKNEKADAVVSKIAKWNRVSLPDNLEVEVNETPTGYIWDMFRTPRLRIRSFIILFNWCVNTLVYYGLSFNTSSLGGNDYINFLLSAVVEVPAYLLTHLALHKVGRRWSLVVSMMTAGVALLCMMAVPPSREDLTWVNTTLATLGKFAITISFTVVYLYTSELYPTVIRNQAMGASSCFARVGGIIAPYFGLLGEYNRFIPPVTFGSLSVAAGLLILLLPETKDRALADTIEEGENFGLQHQRSEAESKGTANKGFVNSEENSYL